MKTQKALIVQTGSRASEDHLNSFLTAGWKVVQMCPMSAANVSFCYCLVIIESTD